MYNTAFSITKALKRVLFPGAIILLSGCAVKKQIYSGNGHESKSSYYTSKAQYESDRKLLLAKDSIRSFDAEIVLTKPEEIANRRLLDLQASMLRYYDSIHFFPPSNHFFKSNAHIYSTPLFALLKKMPKGGIHHLHPSAGGSYWWIVNRAIKEKDCYVFWQNANGQNIKGELAFFKADKVPAGFVSAAALNNSINGFPQKLYDLLRFDGSMMKDSVNIWGEFEYRFQRIDRFTSYQPIFEDFYTGLFDSLAADGVQHVELRTHLSDDLYDLDHPAGKFTSDSVIHYILHAVQRIRNSREPDFTCKLIYTNVRFHPVNVIKEDLVRAFKLRKRYPDLVKAYDLVAHEDAGYTTRFYLDAWLICDSLSKVYGIDLPFCFHDGESDWQHLSNVYDAAMLKSVRIGHGFNLSFFPEAEDMVRRNQICVEVSPLSNQVLGYITDLRMHPAHSWIKHGIQISINPDDPAIFDYVGVTPDYWSIFLAWELDLRSLKKLAINSILYSLLNDTEKEKALSVWKKNGIYLLRDLLMANFNIRCKQLKIDIHYL